MNNIETKHVIAQLANEFMVDGYRNEKLSVNGHSPFVYQGLREDGLYAMYFRISFDMQNYGYEKDGNTHRKEWDRRYLRTIHVLITTRHNVFVAVSETNDVYIPLADWVNSSNHDSCWHSDGLDILDQVACNAYEHCFAFMPEEHKPIPRLAHTFVQFSRWHFGHSPFQIVKVKGEYNKKNDYRWTLTGLERMQYKLNIIDEAQQ